jgi:hypothetical protein
MCTACRHRRRGLDVHSNVAAWLYPLFFSVAPAEPQRRRWLTPGAILGPGSCRKGWFLRKGL